MTVNNTNVGGLNLRINRVLVSFFLAIDTLKVETRQTLEASVSVKTERTNE